jgi:Ca2+-binding EF-hand superfamily protein
VFAKLDRDQDGSLSQQELDARKSHAHAGKRGERSFTRADVNKDGVVERTEALQLADARFTKLDANGDGSVEQSELKGRHSFGKHHAGRCHGGEKTSATDKS